MSDIEIVVPVHTTRHPMLAECVANLRATTGLEPIVWESPGNVSVCRNEALRQVDAEWLCFVDTDAFPQETGWHVTLRDAAAQAGAAIANPFEIFDFGTHLQQQARGPSRLYRQSFGNASGACLMVNRAGCRAWFDENIGYESDFLGPCIEDTDFAMSVAEAGGSFLHETGVTVLHRDRGVADMDEFIRSHEGFCYLAVSHLLGLKHRLGMRDLFAGMGKVPGRGRYLADGYGRDDLLMCFDPVLARLPDDLRVSAQIHLENLSCVFFRKH